ncbi:hypothetical protein SVAN01_03357 [Stagonosporopsis vannaccii]|nr:hypothetical protein SVAN01_03357 [Stagonosporopsis vannaccii]
MALAHSALIQCPEVDALDVWLDYPDCLGVERDRSDFPFAAGEKYPPLRSLRLDGYSFGGLQVAPEEREIEMGYCIGPVGKADPWDAELSWSRVGDWVSSTNHELKMQWEERGGRPKTNLDMWLEAMDWSQLEELSINTKRTEMFDAIAELPKRLTSLKTLHIDSLPFITGLHNHTLETLRWVGPTQPNHLATILSHQGRNLKSLEYRCDELSCPTWPSHTNTTLLPLLAPSLEHVSINLPRLSNGSWPLAHLAPLSLLPSLKSADLYFRLQAPCSALKHFLGHTHPNCGTAYRALQRCHGEDAFEAPYLNASTAQSMFQFLRGENRGKKLVSVTFRTGDWAPPGPQGWVQQHGAERRGVVYCRMEQGSEVCEAVNEGYWQGRYGGEWEWDGDTWVQDDDFEDLEWARERGDIEMEKVIEERMRGRIERLGGSKNSAGL